jgi:flagellar hook-basal body complex protein FliE
MTVGSIEFIAPEITIGDIAGIKPTATTDSFAGWLTREMNAVNSRLLSSDKQIRDLSAGKNDNLHQVMLSLEQARLEFELVLQVRNRLLEGYQEIMRMQI